MNHAEEHFARVDVYPVPVPRAMSSFGACLCRAVFGNQSGRHLTDATTRARLKKGNPATGPGSSSQPLLSVVIARFCVRLTSFSMGSRDSLLMHWFQSPSIQSLADTTALELRILDKGAGCLLVER